VGFRCCSIKPFPAMSRLSQGRKLTLSQRFQCAMGNGIIESMDEDLAKLLHEAQELSRKSKQLVGEAQRLIKKHRELRRLIERQLSSASFGDHLRPADPEDGDAIRTTSGKSWLMRTGVLPVFQNGSADKHSRTTGLE
jgi:hypothetical protein